MNSSATKPAANFQPQMSAYAPTDTSIEPDVVSSLALGRSSSSALPHFSSASRPKKIGVAKRLNHERWGGGAGAGAGAGSYAVGGSHWGWVRSMSIVVV